MRKSNKELLGEVQKLRDEVEQLREMVGALFSLMFEEGEEESNVGGGPRPNDFSIYN